jgi:glycosyltransferase involved in cell wall biosynthesis
MIPLRPLRVVVYPHSMELGGSQLNAIELAAAVRDRGHEVWVYAEEGALVARVRELGLRYVEAAAVGPRPSPVIARELGRLVRAAHADIVHGYEWPPALEAFASTALRGTAAPVVTVMSMAVAPFLPSSMPLVVGTRHIQESVGAGRRGRTDVIEPPVDTHANRPGQYAAEFRATHGLDPRVPTVVVVSRLARELKLEGLLTAIRAIARLATTRRVRFIVVGDGPARPEIQAAAAEANAAAGCEAVLLTGALADPRGAYDAGDVLLGMGGSALRALAFAKPLVVQGEHGFFELLTPASVGQFLENGWYGIGPGTDPVAAEDRFLAHVSPLLDDVDRRAELGSFGRELVETRFSLDHAADVQVEIYRRATAERPPVVRRAADGLVSAIGLLQYKVDRRAARRGGKAPTDDFNSRPV